MKDTRSYLTKFEGPVWADDDVLRYTVKITIWARWVFFIYAVFLLAYRPGFWYPDKIEHIYLQVALAAMNGLVHYRFLTHRPVTRRWMLALSALDIVLITGHVVIDGGLSTIIFLAYYPALGAFAIVFASVWLGTAWTTLVAVVYALAATMAGDGLDIAAGDEKVLVSRIAAMYVMALGISLIVRYERRGRLVALARERQVQQERIEQSRAIHDTTAQTAYMIGLGIDGAMKLADRSNPELVQKLEATSTLAKSAMWELRRPIDLGHLLEGRSLGRVLASHTATFSRITSVSATTEQSGEEPPLSAETRTLLFSIAHNALANAFLHASAHRVEVRLDFETHCIRLSVSDDGIGLPQDYAERGRGFPGMLADAERMGGALVIDSGGPGAGTTVACTVPMESARTGD